MKHLTICLGVWLFFTGINTVYAQQQPSTDGNDLIVDLPENEDSLAEVTLKQTYFILDALDSLTNCLFSGCYKYNDSVLVQKRFAFDTTNFPIFPDSVIIDKMAHMPSVIPMAYNPYVKAYIDLYTVRRRAQVGRMLGIAELYFPIFEQELDRRKMPIELKYLPVIESALNPNAVSKVGATGLWQIMYSTAKWLDLDIHSYLDERRDPYRSTEAAVEYLNRMYGTYGDWLLVIAAYNCGPGNVNKAIKRSGGKKTFWEIRQYLPQETRGYVPAFIAAMYVLHHFEDYKFTPLHTGFSYNQTDTVMVYQQVTLARIADVLGMEQLELEFLNPALTKGEIPPSKKGYALKLPITRIAAFEHYRDSIFISPSAVEVLASTSGPGYGSTTTYNSTTSSTSNSSTTNNASPTVDDGTTTKVTYTVKKGDNLGYISNWFDCTVAEIKKWNKMSTNTLQVGQKLKISVPTYRAEQYRKVEYLSLAQKNRKEHLKTTPVSSKPSTTTASTSNSSNDVKYTPPSTGELTLITYTVKSGDFLSAIASWYDCSVSELQNWNDLTSNSLNTGQKLNVYVPSAKLSKYEPINSMTAAEKAKLGGTNTNNSNTTKPAPTVHYHTVRSGDTLWEIAKKYPGVTVKQIMDQNGLNEGSSLKVGMKLKIQM